MHKALLDANFLVLPFQEPADIFAELERLLGPHYEAYTLNRTYNEALDLEDGAYRDRVEQLVDATDVTLLALESEKDVDDLLLELAGKYVVCTNDAELRTRLAEQNLPYVHLRQHDHLEAKHLERVRG